MTNQLCKIILVLIMIEIVLHAFELYIDLQQAGWFIN
jgi:hypothetical protein